MQDKVFYTTCFGFIFGVLLRSFVFVNLYFSILLGVVAFGLLLFFTLISKRDIGVLVSIFVLTFSLGILRFNAVDKLPSPIFEMQVGQKANFSGEIIDAPDIRETNQKLTIEVESEKEKTQILLSVSLDEVYKYGDEISFEGKLEKPENFITDQGKEFDYVNYLRKD